MCQLDILNTDDISWTSIQVTDTSKTVFLKKNIQSLIDKDKVNQYIAEKTKDLPGSNYGYLSANFKGLLSVSNGNNILVLTVDD